MIKVKGQEALARLMKEWEDRSRAVRAQFVYLVTKSIFEDMQSRIPKGRSLSAYRKSLTFAQITSSEEEPMYSVYSDMDAQSVSRIDRDAVLLYVRVKTKRVRKSPPEIAVLQKYNPWTLDTLPFTPDRRWANVVSRPAKRAQVDKVSKKLTATRSKWSQELMRAGVRLKKKRLVVPKRGVKALPDTAFDAMRTEFGIGSPAIPHWRPAILKFTRAAGLKALMKTPEGLKLEQAMISSDFNEWRKWPITTSQQLMPGEARRFTGFQKRLGIRV